MNLQEFKDKLKGAGSCWEVFKDRYYAEYQPYNSIEDYISHCSIFGIIMINAFTWGITPEGHSYWKSVAEYYDPSAPVPPPKEYGPEDDLDEDQEEASTTHHCECGAEKVGCGHSTWCPKYGGD